jgi:DNA-binding transcriptional LysR family regulator
LRAASDRADRFPLARRAARAALAVRRSGAAAVAARFRRRRQLDSLAVDSVFPAALLARTCGQFGQRFPAVQLRITTETLSTVSALVRDGSCQLGVIGPDASARGLSREALLLVHMIPVAASAHPLARIRGKIPTAEVVRHTQIVLSERGPEPGPDFGVLGHRTWRVTDITTKHALIRAGVGWGNLPEHALADDFAARRLIRLRPADWSPDEYHLSLAIAHRCDAALGQAARWLRETLLESCQTARARGSAARPRRKRSG